MKIFELRKNPWYRRAVTIVTVISIVVLVAHPELRLLLPLVDVLGLDLLIYLAGSQLATFMRPLVYWFDRVVLRPGVHNVFSLGLFLFGVSVSYPEAHVVMPLKPWGFAA
jgi:hypothetical protein